MKTALARTSACIAVLATLFAWAAGMPVASPDLSLLTTIVGLLSAGGAICLLLRRLIDADDKARELGSLAHREETARRQADAMLAETQAVLSKLVRQQDAVRDGERARIARDIQDELGQILLSLRVDLSLLQASSNGFHPAVHQKTTAMIGTLDLALRSLHSVVNDLRPLPAGESLRAAMARELAEFSHSSGIAHRFEAAPAVCALLDAAADGNNALLFRLLQEALAEVAHQASATEVHVSLLRDTGRMLFRIEDNGHGPRRSPASCACGMEGMRERVEALGGDLRLASGPDAGVRLSLSLPTVHGVAAG